MPKLRTVFLSTLCALLAMALFVPSAQAQRVGFSENVELPGTETEVGIPVYTDDEMCEELLADETFDGIADCMQAMGAAGYAAEYPLARHLASAKMAQYLDGTTQIQNVVIARELTRHYNESNSNPA